MRKSLCISAILMTFLQHTTAVRPSNCGFESCHKVKTGMLNVHLIPSSHLDLGWLKTVDQYFWGTKSWIHKVGVQYIYDSLVNELRKDPSRRFTLSEVGYFWMWWKELTTSRRDQIKDLVNAGRLEFVNGGWSMNDEATTTYQAVIDQYTWGFNKLSEMFGTRCAKPRIGWQVDAYGHSKALATLYHMLGFEGLFISRIDYQDKSNRLQTKNMEMVWLPSATAGSVTALFTSVLFNGHRSPGGFCFDILCRNDGLVDDKNSREYNVDFKVQQFIDLCEDQAKYYSTDNIAIIMGDDFHYQSAPSNFLNMDKLIQHVNAKQQTGSRVRLLYSTPSCYLKAVHEASVTWSTKNDDFFPYANDINSYWTGFYSSRPSSKYMERLANNYLQVCKQLHALGGLGDRDQVDMDVLREAMGVMQHHDAITGTERQAVADDYHAMLYDGLTSCEKTIKRALRKIATTGPDGSSSDDSAIDPRFNVDSCLMRNESQCGVSETSDTFVVTVYNPMSHTTSHHVRLPVLEPGYTVQDPAGDDVVSQIVPVPIMVQNLRSRNSKAKYELVFTAEGLPPLGFKSYFVTKGHEDQKTPTEDTDDSRRISNENMHVFLSNVSGHIQELQLGTLDAQKFSLWQDFLFYASDGSGAYLFKPASDEAVNITVDCGVHLLTYKGDVVEEVHQTFGPWVSQVVRLYKEDKHLELEWLIGPIPVENGEGRDVISRFSTELDNQEIFYTDANGREMVERKLNSRDSWTLEVNDPIAGNYYPVATRILIRDPDKGLELGVITDRPQGGSSLRKGEVELMVHRRFLTDDRMGLNEALNEEQFEQGLVVRGKHYVVITKSEVTEEEAINSTSLQKELVQKVINGPLLFVHPADNMTFKEWESTYLMTFRGLKESLPPNVHILTLEPWKDKTLLLRLEHLLEHEKDSKACKPAVVDIDDLFTPFPILGVREMTLGGNEYICDLKRMDWSYANKVCNKSRPICSRKKTTSTRIVLKPMDIRTFIVEIKN
ncbi:lysosomal alpha-mannosidase [Anabrus simplex]|uniref:lysosomal alpha-mannosidase n=1 Tax=Anabrus simplex TaxID=316456 RepID=UPI0035A3D327